MSLGGRRIMGKEYRIYDDRTNETLFEGGHIECMSILSQIDEENEMFPHIWLEKLEGEE